MNDTTNPRVRYLHERGLVTAYIGEGDPYTLDTKAGETPRAIILGTATRHLRKEGASFSGWVVRVEEELQRSHRREGRRGPAAQGGCRADRASVCRFRGAGNEGGLTDG